MTDDDEIFVPAKRANSNLPVKAPAMSTPVDGVGFAQMLSAWRNEKVLKMLERVIEQETRVLEADGARATQHINTQRAYIEAEQFDPDQYRKVVTARFKAEENEATQEQTLKSLEREVKIAKLTKEIKALNKEPPERTTPKPYDWKAELVNLVREGVTNEQQLACEATIKEFLNDKGYLSEDEATAEEREQFAHARARAAQMANSRGHHRS